MCGIVIYLWTRKILRIFCIVDHIGYYHMSLLYSQYYKFNILWVVLTMYGLTERIINEMKRNEICS